MKAQCLQHFIKKIPLKKLKKLKVIDQIIEENEPFIIEKVIKKKQWKKNLEKNSKNSKLTKFKIHLMNIITRIIPTNLVELDIIINNYLILPGVHLFSEVFFNFK